MEEAHSLPTGLIVHERDDIHVLTRLLQATLRPFKPLLVTPAKKQPKTTRLRVPKQTQKQCIVNERQVQGLWVYDLQNRLSVQSQDTANQQNVTRILYFAGGGWQAPPSSHHWAFCTELVKRLHRTIVTVISCPLAPANPASVAFPQIERAYGALSTESSNADEKLVVAGDSSGGNIALCLVIWTLMKGARKSTKPPVAIVAISPTTDLSHRLNEIEAVEKLDPIMTRSLIESTARVWSPGVKSPETADAALSELNGRAYQLDWSFDDPRVSPIKADLSVLVQHRVKVLGVIGTHDVLAPEAIDFLQTCKDEGVGGEWLLWKSQMHCFPLAFRYGLQESKEAVKWIIEAVEKC
ncbi:hypothetical protein AK830_g7002 [Neonectria ditissima]|uniref:Alpha/beta hydrolase fold-3 domain-containing protein n=1 Tax=Neonectria ditissima TaxID=78410 RepID=A0A0P7BF18_9HYPO|nr:hypothetical protein AK830_g7002 [Neonectria ditissima]